MKNGEKYSGMGVHLAMIVIAVLDRRVAHATSIIAGQDETMATSEKKSEPSIVYLRING